MRKAKVLAFLLALAMVVTALVPATVQAAGKVVTVGTQAELEEALKDPEVTKIAIKAKRGKTLVIPEGNYEHIALVVEAAKVKLNNHGTFKVVKVRDAKEYNEHATGNTVKVTAPKITVAVSENAEVKALYLSKAEAENTVVIEGEVKKITVSEPAKVDLTVNGTLDKLNVQKTSEVALAGTTESKVVVNTSTDSYGTTLESSVTVDVRTKDYIDVTLTEGSEGSDVIVKTEAGDVKLDNQTETSVLVEEADGTQHEATLENVVDTRDQTVVEPGTEDDTTEDGETEDTTTEDTTTEDTTGDTATGGSTGSSTTVTPPVVIPTYTVSFVYYNEAGETVVIDTQTVYYGGKATEPAIPDRGENIEFGSWINLEAGEEYSFDTAVTANMTITAFWTFYKNVTFDSNGGSAVASQRVCRGAAATEPVAPTKEGYTFDGWYNGETEYDFETAVSEDITLTAKWKDIQAPVIASPSAISVSLDGTNVDSWTMVTVTATDNNDSTVTVAPDKDLAQLKLTLTKPGMSNVVRYTATDQAGNSSYVDITYTSVIPNAVAVNTADALAVALAADSHVYLTANIDLSGYSWTPAGDGTRSGKSYTGDAFTGVLDGNGYTITTTKNLIGVLDGGTIKNLTVNANINATGDSVAALVGVMVGGTIENVTIKGTVIGDEAVGGVVGRMLADGTVKNCVNNAAVTSTGGSDAAGGIVGKAYYTVTGKEMNITGCTNTGTITGGYAAGGIAGFSAANVMNCSNSGIVSSTGTTAGGIIGEQNNYGEVSGNINTAAITASGSNGNAGGIIGWVRYQNSTSYEANEIVSITGNKNSNNVSGGYNGGGIIGLAYNQAVVTGNENTATKIEGSVFAAGIVGGLQVDANNLTITADVRFVVTGNSTTTTDITGNCTDAVAYNNAPGDAAFAKIDNNTAPTIAQ